MYIIIDLHVIISCLRIAIAASVRNSLDPADLRPSYSNHFNLSPQISDHSSSAERLVNSAAKADSSNYSVLTGSIYTVDSLRGELQANTSIPHLLEWDIQGDPLHGYYVTLDVGTPPQKMNFLIDTGSCNMAVACEPTANASRYFHHTNSSTFQSEYLIVYAPYSQGSYIGKLAHDVLHYSLKVGSRDNATIKIPFQFGCITKSYNFFSPHTPWQGILGLAQKRDVLQPDSISALSFVESLVAHWKAFPQKPIVTISLQLKTEDLSNSSTTGYLSIFLPGANYLSSKHSKSNYSKSRGSEVVNFDCKSNTGSGTSFTTNVGNKWFYGLSLANIDLEFHDLTGSQGHHKKTEEDKPQSSFLDCTILSVFDVIVDTGTTDLKMPAEVYEKFMERFRSSVVARMDQAIYNTTDNIKYIDLKHLSAMYEDTTLNGNLMCLSNMVNSDRLLNMLPSITLEVLTADYNSTFRIAIPPSRYLFPFDFDTHNLSHLKVDQHSCYKLAISESRSDNFIIGAIAYEGLTLQFNAQNHVLTIIGCKTLSPSIDITRQAGLEKISFGRNVLAACHKISRGQHGVGFFSRINKAIIVAYVLSTFLMIVFLTIIATSQCRAATKRCLWL